MRFNVPQFIDVEDKIIGPLSMKQFVLVLVAALFLILIWYFFALWFVMLLGIPLIIGILAVLFLKVGGRPLTTLATAWFNFWTNPKIYVWKKNDNK